MSRPRGSDPVDAYEILGVAEGATTQEIDARFRALALRYHPDRAELADRHLHEETFKRIVAARDALRDPVRRARVDAARGARPGGRASHPSPAGGSPAPSRPAAPSRGSPSQASPRHAAARRHPAAGHEDASVATGDRVADYVEFTILPAMESACQAKRYRDVERLYGQHVASLYCAWDLGSRRSRLWARGADLVNKAQLSPR